MNTWLSIVPPLVAIVLAIVTRQVYVSLLIGLITGATILSGGLISGLTGGVDAIAGVFASGYIAKNILFLLLIGSLIKILSKSGGIRGLVNVVTERTKLVRTKKGAQVAPFIAGLSMFTEGIGSMMVAGLVGRPLCDKEKVPREKLAFICNSTGAPVALLFPFGGAGAFIMGMLGGQIEAGTIEGNPLTILLSAIPFQFYTILILLAVPAFIFLFKDFGAMKKANHEYEEKGIEAHDINKDVDPSAKGGIINMIVPLVALVVSILAIILITGKGILAQGDTTAGIYWGIFAALTITCIFLIIKKETNLNKFIGWCIEGMKDMIPAVTILVMAFAMGNIAGELQTGVFLSRIVIGNVHGGFLPAAIFITCCLISFSTGSTGATLGIMIPITVPMIAAAGLSVPMAVGAVISGALFGDQSSPISDSVIVSSMAAGCGPLDHFRTQIPYTLTVSGIAFLLFLIFGFIF